MIDFDRVMGGDIIIKDCQILESSKIEGVEPGMYEPYDEAVRALAAEVKRLRQQLAAARDEAAAATMNLEMCEELRVEWKDRHRLRLVICNMWPVRQMQRLRVIVRHFLTGDCGMAGCGYMEPYGFVPEAGCPVHDKEKGEAC